MIVELWMRKREIEDEDENDVEDTSRNDKSEVQLARLGYKYFVAVL
jgi:hypothetical protein